MAVLYQEFSEEKIHLIQPDGINRHLVAKVYDAEDHQLIQILFGLAVNLLIVFSDRNNDLQLLLLLDEINIPFIPTSRFSTPRPGGFNKYAQYV